MGKLPDFEENRRKWEKKAEEKKEAEWLSKVESARGKLKAEEARKKLREPIWGPREPNLYWKKMRLARKEADEAALRRVAKGAMKAWDKAEEK